MKFSFSRLRRNSIIEVGKFRQALPQFLAVGVKNILLFGKLQNFVLLFVIDNIYNT